jgi:TonB family protein
MRFTWTKILSLNLALAVILFIAGLPSAAFAQTPADWETVRPDDSEFTVLMPPGSTKEAGEHSYQKRLLKTRLFVSTSEGEPVLAVTTITGIKANPALYSEVQRLNSYVDAFKNWFPQKLWGQDAIGKMTLAGNKTVNGHAGREYHLAIGNFSGTAQVYLTRKRFYAIVALNTKRDEALEAKFLGSFVLPEKSLEVQANVAGRSENPEGAAEQPDSSAAPKPVQPPKSDADSGGATVGQEGHGAPPEAPPGQRAPISGGVLNGKALSLPAPPYPPIARKDKASGLVVVQVLIDEYGNVVSASAGSGHPLLRAAAVQAARQAKFPPTRLMGEPIKVSGELHYTFIPD